MIARNPFAAWTVIGILFGLAPFFLFALPLAVVGAVLVRRRTREPDDLLGVVCGIGLVLLLVPSWRDLGLWLSETLSEVSGIPVIPVGRGR